MKKVFKRQKWAVWDRISARLQPKTLSQKIRCCQWMIVTTSCPRSVAVKWIAQWPQMTCMHSHSSYHRKKFPIVFQEQNSLTKTMRPLLFKRQEDRRAGPLSMGIQIMGPCRVSLQVVKLLDRKVPSSHAFSSRPLKASIRLSWTSRKVSWIQALILATMKLTWKAFITVVNNRSPRTWAPVSSKMKNHHRSTTMSVKLKRST